MPSLGSFLLLFAFVICAYAIAASVAGRLPDGRVQPRGGATGFGPTPLVLEVRADAAPPSAAAPVPFDQRPIEARLSWSGRLAPLMAALPFDKVVLDGDGAVTAGLTGSLAAPHLSGRIQVSGGRYENYTLGTLLTPLDIDVRLNDTAIVIERFEAGDGGDGRLAVTGRNDITDPEPPGVAVTATARAAPLSLMPKPLRPSARQNGRS